MLDLFIAVLASAIIVAVIAAMATLLWADYGN